MKIRAAILDKPNTPLRFGDVHIVSPARDELIVKVTCAAICHTDIGVQAFQPLPAVLGHEAAGVVVECGDAVDDLKIGDRVALTFGSCGRCTNCVADYPSHCANVLQVNFSGLSPGGETTLYEDDGRRVHGSFFYQSSFASHALVSQRNAVRLPFDLDDALVAPLGCGVQTGAGAVLNVLKAQAGSSFVCFGVGAVGLSAVMAAKIAGCAPIIVIDPNVARRELALSLGATHALPPGEKVTQEIQDITGGGADYSFETAGVADTFHQAIASLNIGGHAALAAVPNWVDGFHFVPSALALGRTVTGVLEGSSRPKSFIPTLCGYVRDGRMPIDRLITRYAFEDINVALDDLHHGRAIKPVMMMP